MEYGFYHPDHGYWQAISMPDSDTRAAYPVGAVEVPLRPSAAHAFDGSQWALPVQTGPDAIELG